MVDWCFCSYFVSLLPNSKIVLINSAIVVDACSPFRTAINLNIVVATSRTPTGRRVSNVAPDIQQNPNDSASLEHNHMVDNNTHASELEEMMPQNTSELMNGTNEQDDGHDTTKKTRGPTYMLEIWGRSSTMPHIKLDFDCYGRPIGTNRSKFCEFLGTISRNGMYCPLDVEDWQKMPTEYKKKMLNIVKSRYDITHGDEDLMDEKDGRVLQDQWNKLLTYWNREEVKARSEKNRDARSKRSMNHLTRKRSFAQIQDNLVSLATLLEAKEKGRPPSHAEMLDACYTSDNNTSSVVSKYLEEIEELRKKLPESSEDPVGPNGLFAQVRGQDRAGRVRMFGEGVSPSDVWGEIHNRNTSRRYVHNIGLKEEAGIQVLGENWCQIHINSVLQSDEQLIRPHDFCEGLGDAHGEMIVWPCNLLAVLPPSERLQVVGNFRDRRFGLGRFWEDMYERAVRKMKLVNHQDWTAMFTARTDNLKPVNECFSFPGANYNGCGGDFYVRAICLQFCWSLTHHLLDHLRRWVSNLDIDLTLMSLFSEELLSVQQNMNEGGVLSAFIADDVYKELTEALPLHLVFEGIV
ncbi:hypothetical protein C2S51_013820 [Perilla frutescens var. frutescens]|nr:hypothetical protein C2S51_013820 [Perilla frutescens var. frutescens]